MGIASGAAKGAMACMGGGPWAAAICGLVGGVIGGIKSKSKSDAADKAVRDKQKQANKAFERDRLATKFQSTTASFTPEEASRIQAVMDPNKETYGSMFTQQS